MALAALSTNELLQQVKGTVGEANYTTAVPMRPDQGYMSLVSFWFLLLLPALPLPSHPFDPFRRGCGATKPLDLRFRRTWLAGRRVGWPPRRRGRRTRCGQEAAPQEVFVGT